MYQYIAILHKSQEVVAEGHDIEEIKKQVVHFKREQKYDLHTNMNNKIEVFHVFRDEGKGVHTKKLITTL